MSHADHGDGDDGEEPDHPLAVADPEDYSQNQRLKDIHETRRRVREIRHTAVKREKAVRGEYKAYTATDRNADVAAAVADYILEAEPILHRLNADYSELHEFLDDNHNPYQNPPPLAESMQIHRECTHALADAGLGLDISESNEWEV